MHALILAAGMGKRLGEYTKNQTKCMVRVNGVTLIERALDALVNIDISKIILVVGYEGEKLREFIGDNYKGIKVKYVFNDVYNKTNNIYSLGLASEYLAEDDTILLESDLIFEEGILHKVIQDPNPNIAVVAPFESWMDGTVTVLNEENDIVSFVPKKGFKWNNCKDYYKTVNIYKFSKEFSKNCYIPFLKAYIQALGNNEYYEQVLRVMTYIDNLNLKAFKLTNEKWYEIDDVQDLDIAEVLFADFENELKMYQKRFGGYWRFPKLKDFCYLVNPYFPNEKMLDEFKSNFDVLLSEYPSGLNTQNLLASKMFGCRVQQILVGNGAAELIRGVFKAFKGTVGVTFPTFNEYPESAGYDRVKKFIPKNDDFSYTVDELKEFSKDVDALLLINPDNPSGHFMTKEEVLDLLVYLKAENKYLIYDESFVDFAGEDAMFTLINSELLESNKNLIVIKSISKSYGVPGARLGVLANGDIDLIAKIRSELSIWNINSFGEYFLQIIGKYQDRYAKACVKISEERDRFYEELSKICFLRVIPTKANYFLCEVTDRFTSGELTRLLLNKYSIFIKDCTGKIAFENKQYVRIAVRDFEDNNFIISKLKEIENN
ncbi:aminotransferase class I/II-fold pyridoxal phosphate-dependent enzyme [Clostridium omnivorum]|uniref:Aminotransferase n=1 Tax=Clostridium omnivorum TaxID=1604902 RepID=A0ABQ5N3D6_9CLOT|nr:aminotransferase class I/II-fold pyridoxal phosphate-dependent enzyme [Clostridium sp. E14]GLC29696.1 aminotransferase [Clostridium sp. E14]